MAAMAPRTETTLRRYLWSLCLAACGPSPGVTGTSGDNLGTTTTTTTTPATTDIPPTSTLTSISSEPASSTTEPATGTTFGGLGCGEALVAIPVTAPAPMLVLDQSRRTGDAPELVWDHDADDLDADGQHDADPMQPATPRTRKWASLHAAVDELVHRFDLTLWPGLALFPAPGTLDSDSAATCAVAGQAELAPGPEQAAALVAALPPADAPVAGAQPIAAAYQQAVLALTAVPERPRHIVLVTSSAANCHAGAADAQARLETLDPDLLPAVSAAAASGIVTHVVGLDLAAGTTPALPDGQPDTTDLLAELTALADAGGTPPHNVHSEPELRATLDAIARSTLACSFVLAPPPTYPDFVELLVGDTNYGHPKVSDCASEDGWHFLDEATLSFELCGSACAEFQTSGDLTAQYRCPND